jgi:hypothetical protein
MAKYLVKLPNDTTDTLEAAKFEVHDGVLTLFNDEKPKQTIISYAADQWLSIADEELWEAAGETAD